MNVQVAASRMDRTRTKEDTFMVLLAIARGEHAARTVMIYAHPGEEIALSGEIETFFRANTIGRFATRLNFKPHHDIFGKGNTFYAGCYARAKDRDPETTPVFVSSDRRMEGYSNSRKQARILWIDARDL
ncbi:MAG: hypothetical protein EOP83_32575 [Verrucomicrobiaceae bacterium]|nr:MAG: hypothetical protein EOP83_32575 [Verrucomicrobiaceae bacterium]